MVKQLIQQAFSKHLLLTNFAIGSGFMLGGDALLQTITRPGEPMDWRRTRNMAIMGMGFGILGHGWYGFLDRKFPGRSWTMIRRKLFAECAATPAFAGYTFFAYGTLQGRTPSQCRDDFWRNLYLICIADWCGYVPAQALNFYFLPPQFRFLYVCGLSVVYDMFLAWALNKDHDTHTDERREN